MLVPTAEPLETESQYLLHHFLSWVEWTGWTFWYSRAAQDLSVSFLEKDLERIEITKNEIKWNKRKLSRRNVFCWHPNILSWLKVCSRRNNGINKIAPKIIREGILLALSLGTTLLLWYNDMKDSYLYLLWKICLSQRENLHDLLCEELATAKKTN